MLTKEDSPVWKMYNTAKFPNTAPNAVEIISNRKEMLAFLFVFRVFSSLFNYIKIIA